MVYFILFMYEAVICHIYDSRHLDNRKTFAIEKYKLKVSTIKGIFSLSIIVPLWLVMGLRYNIGVDYKSYEYIFQLARLYHSNGYSMELGYYYFNRLAGYISANPQIIFFLTAFLIIFFLYKGIEKNDGSMYYGILGCMGLGYYFYAMNIQRQYIAIMIMLYAFHFLEEKRLLEFLICLVGAVSFHFSAIVWLPVYFAINYMPSKIFYAGSLIIAILANRFGGWFLARLANIGFYTGQILRNKSFFSEHFSWLNVLMLGGFLICRFFFKAQPNEKLKKINLRYKAIWLAFLIYAFIYIYGGAASRIAVYLSVICLLLIADIVNCFDVHTRKWVKRVITLMFMVLMFIVITYTGNQNHAYLPYKYRLL